MRTLAVIITLAILALWFVGIWYALSGWILITGGK